MQLRLCDFLFLSAYDTMALAFTNLQHCTHCTHTVIDEAFRKHVQLHFTCNASAKEIGAIYSHRSQAVSAPFMCCCFPWQWCANELWRKNASLWSAVLQENTFSGVRRMLTGWDVCSGCQNKYRATYHKGLLGTLGIRCEIQGPFKQREMELRIRGTSSVPMVFVSDNCVN